MQTKKEWQLPELFLLNSNDIESGGGAAFAEEQKFLATAGCGVSGTVVATIVSGSQKVKICQPTCNTVYFNISANGQIGATLSVGAGLCS